MPKKSASRDMKNLPSFSEDQDLDGFDGDVVERSKSQKSIGSRSSGGGSRKSRDKKASERGSKQGSKIGSSTIEKVRL
jgi:hypothetical protein